MLPRRVASRTTAAARVPIAFAPSYLPRPIQAPTGAESYPLAPMADAPTGGSATVTVGEEPKAETPWLLYAGIAAAVAAVGYVVYVKKIKKGRR
jgi:hypothetical protein